MALPKVGVQAVLLLRDFERTKKKYEKLLDDIVRKTEQMSKGVQKTTRDAGKSFEDFVNAVVSSEKIGEDASRKFFNSIEDLAKAFDNLEEKETVNIDRFIQNLAGGQSATEAFGGAIDGAATSLVSVGAAVTAVSVILGATLKIIKESVDAYEELGREVRIVSLELGISATEASGWVDAANRAGVSSSTLNRAMTQLSRNIVNYRVAQLKGEEETNKFAQAMQALDIDLEGPNKQLKTASELFIELQQKARELGPGVVTLGELSNALGFSTRQLVELLFDESLALDKASERALFYGNTLGEIDKERTRKLTESTNNLKAAWEGFTTLIARVFEPAITRLKELLADLINTIRRVLVVAAAFRATVDALEEGALNWAFAINIFNKNLQLFTAGTTAAAEEAAALKREQDALRQEAIVAAAAQDDLNEVLKEQQKVMEKLNDAWDKYQDRRADINRRFDDQQEDAGIRETRERIKRNLELSFKLEDIYIKRGIRLRELEFKWVNEIDKIQRDQARKIEDFQRDAARAREKIAVKHRENLLKIENKFNDTVEEAARTNDTVAVVRAIRTRNRGIRDETRRFTVEQQELEKDLKIKRDKINQDAERRKEEQINRDGEERARIERQFKDEINALSRKHTRELTLSRNKDRERREDIERNRSQALRDAEIYYQREEQALVAHLDRMAQIAIQKGAEVLRATRYAFSPPPFYGPPRGGSSGGQSPADLWRAQNPSYFRAHGGVDVVNSPTTFVAGEAGAEIAAFIPLSQSRNINHSFGKLPIDFQGLPGGMNTGQVEAIVYSAMVELARTLGASQRR